MDSYRTLDAWKLPHELCIRTLLGTEEITHPKTWAAIDQLRRAVVSVEANVVEGCALRTRAYLLKHLRIAFGSAAEAECLIRTAAEVGYIPEALATELLALAKRCLEVLRGYMRKHGA